MSITELLLARVAQVNKASAANLAATPAAKSLRQIRQNGFRIAPAVVYLPGVRRRAVA
jgi:hypothetical protein